MRAATEQLLTRAKRFLEAIDDLTDLIEDSGPLSGTLEKIHDCRYVVSTAVEEMEIAIIEDEETKENP